LFSWASTFEGVKVNLNRRDILKLAGVTIVGSVALGVPLGRGPQTKGSVSRLSSANFPKQFSAVINKLPAAVPSMVGGVAYYDFTMRRHPAAQILTSALTTPVFGYDGTFPGPRIELNRGTPAVVRHHNELPAVGPFGSPAKTSVHLHGSASLPEYDGYANDTTAVGEYKDYRYPNHQVARTLWYHDHGVHWTAQQAYGGLAAMYVLHDKQEQTLLPKGDFDIPLMVNDASFEADGSLWYEDNLHSGLWGDVLLVNGRPWPVMQVQRRTYRFRILNCSVSRSYTWRLSNGMPLQVVATDGGLMPKGVAVSSMRHGGAERYEVVIDFSKVPAGTTRVELLNDSNENNIDYAFTGKVMAFDLLDTPVTKTRANYDNPAVKEPDPTWNRDYNGFPLVASEVMSLDPRASYPRRHFKLKRDDVTGQFRIDDRTWQQVEQSNYTYVMADPKIGDVEVWEFENSSGGWFHPVHIHLIDFRIIKRTGGVGAVLPHEEGPKDVMYVGEGETVHVLIKFTAPGGDASVQGGRYMVHCHNLPHEDHDMMSQFSVGTVNFANDPHDPIKAAPPTRATAPGAPALVTAIAGNASAVVRWSAPIDNGSAILGYSVRVIDSMNQPVGALRTASARATSLTVTGLLNGTRYRFQVQARSALGAGAFSVVSNAVTPATVATAPVIGTAMPGLIGGAINATARWTPPLSNGGSVITGYVVTARQMSASDTILRQILSPVQSAGARSLTMNLPAGNYRFVVRAQNAVGTGATSARSRLVTAR